MRTTTPSREVRLHGLRIESRLDRIPVYPWPKTTVLILGLSFLFAAFDIGDIGAILPRASEEFGVGIGQLSIVASLGLVGFIVGEVVASVISDLYGRRPSLIAALLVVGLGSIGTAVSPNVALLAGLRFLSGMGIGASICVITTFLTELPPATVRGRYAGWALCTNATGLFLATAAGFGLVPHVAIGWRILLAIPILALLVAWAVARIMPESPRWLAEHGRIEQADQLVTAAERRARDRLGADLPTPPDVTLRERSTARFLQLFRPPQLKWTILMFAVWFVNYLPVYGLTTLGTTVLTRAGYTLQESIGLGLGGAAAGIVGALLVPYMSDRFDRKYPAAAISIIAGVLWILVALHTSSTTIVIAYIALYMQTGIFSGLIYTATAEHFPTEARSVGVGFADGLGHIGGAIAPLVGTATFLTFGTGGFFTLAGVMFALLGLIVLLTRSTARRQLEDLRTTAPTATVSATTGATSDERHR
jgi:putative MFS transporter